MSEDLQSLLEKINRDGVEKAEAEAQKIIDAANRRAAEIVSSAKDEAARAKADAERYARTVARNQEAASKRWELERQRSADKPTADSTRTRTVSYL